ncbi:hypothetical protein K474DRAFT_1672424 [Panus rudis PR-1116 ss-1]|nr:hypothetical protein K474DRAFT_1672424 [Panus rudis PR-1116 ss-1]
MSYSGYNSAPYPPQVQPGYPPYPPAPGIAQGGPYPPQGSPPPGGGYPQQGGYHDPNQPPYGELLLAVFVKPSQYSHGSDQGGYQQPGYSSPSPSYAGGPGGYIPTYTPTYNAGSPGYAPQGSPALGHKGPSPAPSQEYAGTPPGIPVYGAPPAYGTPSAGYPGQYLPAQPGYGAPGPQSGYGHAPSAAPAPISTTPVRFQFAQKKGFDRSGKIIDENKNVVYVLKDEADEHSWTKYLKSRPLMISRADGTKVCSFHWKDGPNEAEAKVFAVWAQKGEKKKMKVSGDILDQE